MTFEHIDITINKWLLFQVKLKPRVIPTPLLTNPITPDQLPFGIFEPKVASAGRTGYHLKTESSLLFSLSFT